MKDNPYLPPSTEALPAWTDERAEELRLDHLSVESSLRVMGSLGLLTPFLVLPIIIFVLHKESQFREVPVFWIIATSLFTLVLIYQMFIANKIRRLEGEARKPARILSALGLMAFPIGIGLIVHYHYLLGCQKGRFVLSPEYQQIIKDTPHLTTRKSFRQIAVIITLWGLIILLVAYKISNP